jgi:hypothetical protein
MKWSSQPGASTATNASATLAPERSIAALKVSLSVDGFGPLRFDRAAGDDAHE